MTQDDKNEILAICKRRMDKGEVFDSIKSFVIKRDEELFNELEDELLEYSNKRNERLESNKPYWMLICNPSKWYEETEAYEVNELLYNLDETTIEPWKINFRTSMNRQMKKGHRGIIKVSEDTRSEIDRMDPNGETVPRLQSGIYGIFEVVEDEDGDCTYETENGEWFVNIKVMENYFREGVTIPKNTSIELLGENVYKSQTSTKIDRVLFEKVADYISMK